jgi:protease II
MNAQARETLRQIADALGDAGKASSGEVALALLNAAMTLDQRVNDADMRDLQEQTRKQQRLTHDYQLQRYKERMNAQATNIPPEGTD